VYLRKLSCYSETWAHTLEILHHGLRERAAQARLGAKMKYLCSYCNTFTFDTEIGEPRANLPKGIRLEDIPASHRCPVCGRPKSFLKPITDAEFKVKKANYDKQYPEAKDIVSYRDISRQILSGICAANKVCDGNPDRLCMGMKYGHPIGFGGAGQGSKDVFRLCKIRFQAWHDNDRMR